VEERRNWWRVDIAGWEDGRKNANIFLRGGRWLERLDFSGVQTLTGLWNVSQQVRQAIVVQAVLHRRASTEIYCKGRADQKGLDSWSR